MNSPVIRTMPSNEEAEQALIGALLNDNEKIDQIKMQIDGSFIKSSKTVH